MDEYRKKADNMDNLLGEGGQNRVRRRLDQFGQLMGLVVGQFNEVSEDTHKLIEQMAVWSVEGKVDTCLTRRGGLLWDS